MNEVAAWVMQIDRMSRVAVGQLELIHIIANPEYIEVPKAPRHCKRVVMWNNKVIPVMDLSILVNDASAFYQHNSVAVALYAPEGRHELQYGGIQLIDMPVLDKVSNQQQVTQSELSEQWKPLSVSAYRGRDSDIIPILDLPKLFSPDITRYLYQQAS